MQSYYIFNKRYFFYAFLQLIKQIIENKTYRIARAEKYFNRKLSKALVASTALFSIGNGKERENLANSQTSNMNQTLLTLVTNPRCQKLRQKSGLINYCCFWVVSVIEMFSMNQVVISLLRGCYQVVKLLNQNFSHIWYGKVQ